MEKMHANERRKKILSLLSENRDLRIDDLSSYFNVSGMTIRRDLEKLEDSNMIQRNQAGTQTVFNTMISQLSFMEKQKRNTLEKIAIAKAAAEVIKDGDVIAICPGSTTSYLVQYLNGFKNITIVSNAANILLSLSKDNLFNVIVIGGILKMNSFALVGSLAMECISKLHINRLFMGASGISFEKGITTYDMEEAPVYKKLISISDQVIVMSDSTKMNHSSLSTVADLEEIDLLITDRNLSEEDRNKLRNKNIQFRIAN